MTRVQKWRAPSRAGHRKCIVQPLVLARGQHRPVPFLPQYLANALDGEVLNQVEAFDPEGVFRVEEEGKGFACGHDALAAVLWAAKDLGAEHLPRCYSVPASGDVTGDYDQVVGYGAAVFTRQKVGE